jgi:hypothetical protein
MATVYLSLAKIGVRGIFGDHDVITGPMRSETITSSGASAAGALIAGDKEVARVFCATAVYATTAATPTATATNGVYCPAGQLVTFGVPEGHKVAVIDVA